MNRSIKRILSVALVLMILCGLLPMGVLATDVTSGTCGEDVTWCYDKATGTLSISGNGKMTDYKSRTPWSSFAVKNVVVESGVMSIGTNSFSGCSSLVSATIGAVNVGDMSFSGCENLKTVYLLEGVVSIGYAAFAGCTKLQSLKIPNTVTSVFYEAFGSTGLKSVIIGNGLTSIRAWTFSGCQDLSSIVIPISVKTIEESAFLGCEALSEVNYTGTASQWKNIQIFMNNDELRNAPKNYRWVCEHISKLVPEIAPTCTENGFTAGLICGYCGEVLQTQSVILAKGHSLESGICVDCGTDNPFIDVNKDDWFYSSVKWAINNNVTGGTSSLSFSPNDACTRAQVVTFLWAAKGKPEPVSMDNPFDDVPNDSWYLKPVLWAVENGITGGVAEGKFGPEQACTRAQIVTFLYAAEGKPYVSGRSNFKDVKNGDWFAKAVIWAEKYDVTGGIGDGKFGPNNTCTRAQVVTFLFKADQIDSSGYEQKPNINSETIYKSFLNNRGYSADWDKYVYSMYRPYKYKFFDIDKNDIPEMIIYSDYAIDSFLGFLVYTIDPVTQKVVRLPLIDSSEDYECTTCFRDMYYSEEYQALVFSDTRVSSAMGGVYGYYAIEETEMRWIGSVVGESLLGYYYSSLDGDGREITHEEYSSYVKEWDVLI